MSDSVVLDGIRWETYERLREDLDAKERHVHLVIRAAAIARLRGEYQPGDIFRADFAD